MANDRGKALERYTAKKLGGIRRGPDNRNMDGGGMTDVKHDWLNIECKDYQSIGFQLILDAVVQAETNGCDKKMSVAVIHRVRDRMTDTIICLRLDEFCDWFVTKGE